MKIKAKVKRALAEIYKMLKTIYLDIILLVLIPAVYSRVEAYSFNKDLEAYILGNQTDVVLRENLIDRVMHHNRFPIIYIAILFGFYLYRYDKRRRNKIKENN